MADHTPSPTPPERDLVAVLIFVAASAVFVLAVLSLRLGVTSFSLWVKLMFFAAACVFALLSMGMAVGVLTLRRRYDDLLDEEELMSRVRRRARVRLATGLLAAAMLLTAVTAVGRLPPARGGKVAGTTKPTVSVVPHVDLRGARLVLGGSGTNHRDHAVTFAGKALATGFLPAFKQALSVLGHFGSLLGPLAKADIAFAPNFYFGGGKGGNVPSLDRLTAALERAHIKVSLTGAVRAPPPRARPIDCARYYLELDELAYDEPKIASRWPAPSGDEQARACGLGNSQAMARLLNYLGTR
jgi:hypothetical protein